MKPDEIMVAQKAIIGHQVITDSIDRDNRKFIIELREILEKANVLPKKVERVISYVTQQFNSLLEESEQARTYMRREIKLALMLAEK